jgi:hypothetical protein
VVPKSPWTTPDAHSPYWTNIGLSRLSSTLFASITVAGGRGLRLKRFSRGSNCQAAKEKTTNDASASSTT